MRLNGPSIREQLGRLRATTSGVGTRNRPTLVKADGSLVILTDPERCIVLPEFFRTGGELAWDRTEKALIWKTGPGQAEERMIPLPAAPDLTSLGRNPGKKSSWRPWAIGMACFLILPALWVHLFLPTGAPAGLASPSRFGGVPAVPSPGPVSRISGTGWMK